VAGRAGEQAGLTHRVGGLLLLPRQVGRLEALARLGTARTCSQLTAAGLRSLSVRTVVLAARESGQYFIDPDGPGVGAPPVQVSNTTHHVCYACVQVYCDLRSGTTRVGHDLPGEQKVTNCRSDHLCRSLAM
jgi:hypothetical protein